MNVRLYVGSDRVISAHTRTRCAKASQSAGTNCNTSRNDYRINVLVRIRVSSDVTACGDRCSREVRQRAAGRLSQINSLPNFAAIHVDRGKGLCRGSQVSIDSASTWAIGDLDGFIGQHGNRG